VKIIITIPAYNEERTLPRVIEEIKLILKNHNYNYQFLVLDDGSTDKTVEVAKECGAIVVSNRTNRGLAETFQREMEECLKLKADIIIHTDADGQYHPKHIPEMIEKVKEGYDLVLGSRFRKSTRHMPFLKKIGNKAFASVISSLTGTKITDSTTGFRAFTAEIAREINYINTFTYTQEQIIKAAKQGFRISEIPIICRKTRESKLFKSPIQYAIKAWINILRIYRDYNPLKFFGYAGGSLFLIGALLGVFIFIRILLTGSAGGIPRVILSALLMMVGIQIILFGFLADMLKR
jgi:glycosyltransferase involved in cell wall biosynthesis